MSYPLYQITMPFASHHSFSPLPYSRGGATWAPDAEWIKQFDGPVLLPPEEQDKNLPPPWTHKLAPIEKKVRNVTINFGPQHPAAHGVLRLVLELDGEVSHDVHMYTHTLT